MNYNKTYWCINPRPWTIINAHKNHLMVYEQLTTNWWITIPTMDTIVLGQFWHKLNYFQLCRKFQKKFNPLCWKFQKHIQGASQFWTNDLLDQTNYFTSIWPLTQWNIFKIVTNFIKYITHMLNFSKLKR